MNDPWLSKFLSLSGTLRYRWLRRRFYEILEHDAAHDRAAEIFTVVLIGLILANVVAAVLETVPTLLLHDLIAFRLFEAISLVVFGVEYALRVWVAPENPRYRGLAPWRARLKHALTPTALVDLVAWLPFVLAGVAETDLRTLAVLRLLRFAKLARYSPGMQSLLEVLRSERQSLTACLWLLIGAVLVTASAMYVAERHVQPDHFGSIPLAMWWSVVTVTTVGYGDAYPLTVTGRMIAGVTMVMGIILLALPVGIIATAFVEVIKRRDFVISWGMVARVPLFAELDAAGIGEVHKLLSSHRAQPGEILVRRGDLARSMYFIASGEIELEFEDEVVVLGEGQFFGEMALVHETKRAATARARRRSMLLVLDSEDLATVMRRHPEIGRSIRGAAREQDGSRVLGKHSDIAGGEIEG